MPVPLIAGAAGAAAIRVVVSQLMKVLAKQGPKGAAHIAKVLAKKKHKEQVRYLVKNLGSIKKAAKSPSTGSRLMKSAEDKLLKEGSKLRIKDVEKFTKPTLKKTAKKTAKKPGLRKTKRLSPTEPSVGEGVAPPSGRLAVPRNKRIRNILQASRAERLNAQRMAMEKGRIKELPWLGQGSLPKWGSAAKRLGGAVGWKAPAYLSGGGILTAIGTQLGEGGGGGQPMSGMEMAQFLGEGGGGVAQEEKLKRMKEMIQIATMMKKLQALEEGAQIGEGATYDPFSGV